MLVITVKQQRGKSKNTNTWGKQGDFGEVENELERKLRIARSSEGEALVPPVKKLIVWSN